MAKPTKRQKEVIELVSKLCGYWLTTNDLHSPSHDTDIDSEVSNMTIDDTITVEQGERLAEAIGELRVQIALLDKCTFRFSHGG
jgi:hypothetical protein